MHKKETPEEKRINAIVARMVEERTLGKPGGTYPVRKVTTKNYLVCTSKGNLNFRSSYEVAFVMYLEKKRIKWEYESKTFYLPGTQWCSYTPDFFLPTTKQFIEIKGAFLPDTKAKMKAFRRLFPEVKLTILQKPALIKMIGLKTFNEALTFCNV